MECLVIKSDRELKSEDVVMTSVRLLIVNGVTGDMSSGNGSELQAKNELKRIEWGKSRTLHIEHGIPLENDYNEAFTVKYSDKLLDRGILYRLKEALIQIKEWRQHCKTFQLHSSLQYQPPAPEAVQNLIQKL